MKYSIEIRINTAKLVKPVDDLEQSINKTMGEFGFSEKLVMTSIIPHSLNVSRLLTYEEKVQITKIIEEQYASFSGKVEKFELEGGETIECND